MKLSSICAVAIAALALSGPCWAQQARTAHDAGLAIAKKRGYSNPACFASVYATYATQNSRGEWRAPMGRTSGGYKQEQHTKCGISV